MATATTMSPSAIPISLPASLGAGAGAGAGATSASVPPAGTGTGTAPRVRASRAPGPIPPRAPKDIECWGHRGASAHLPENTLASFRAAIKEGADAIESDVHATSDGVILMFHDPTLERTTTGTGLIRTQAWEGVIEHVRTTKEPVQPIPLFSELIELLMEPENQHVSLNIDCKMQNDPERLFPEMARIISQYPSWQTALAPRLILGLWHPLFLPSALAHLPLLRRYHIGFSIDIAKRFFWDACEGFSICFPLLMGREGQAFIDECRREGKELCVWTVNDADEMRTAMGWGVKAVLTDKVGDFVRLKDEVVSDPAKLPLSGLRASLFGWSSWRYYSIAHVGLKVVSKYWLGAHGSLPSSIDNLHLDAYLALADPDPNYAPPAGIAAADSPRAPALTLTSPSTSTAATATNDDASDTTVTHPAIATATIAPTTTTTTASTTPLDTGTATTSSPTPTSQRPARRISSVSKSIMTWIDTTAAHGTEKLFTST